MLAPRRDVCSFEGFTYIDHGSILYDWDSEGGDSNGQKGALDKRSVNFLKEEPGEGARYTYGVTARERDSGRALESSNGTRGNQTRGQDALQRRGMHLVLYLQCGTSHARQDTKEKKKGEYTVRRGTRLPVCKCGKRNIYVEKKKPSR